MNSDAPKTEKKLLRYDFTAVEIHDLSIKLAGKTKELAAVTEEKKSVTAQYGAKMKSITAETNKISNLVSDGFELREVECEILWHVPERGRKTLVRKDNGHTLPSEAMEPYEYDLFNQPKDDDPDYPTETEETELYDVNAPTSPAPAEKSSRRGKGGKKK